MIPEFLEYISELFPSISPYTEEGAKRALEQYESSAQLWGLTERSGDYSTIWQGDVFSNVPFVLLGSDGGQEVAWLDGMLITNSCDCLRKDYLQFAACVPFDLMDGDEARMQRMKNNKLFEYLYLPDRRVENCIVDLGRIVSIPREFFERLLNEGIAKRKLSLTWVGYYIFICKLTVFFMRPESEDVSILRAS